MCGIAGYQGRAPLSEDWIAACEALMRRRGPDGHGRRDFTAQDGTRTVLLHSRLAIIDLDERSAQPMGSHGMWIAFNGELYNYLEHIDPLKRRGVSLRTRSDTEVLLELLRLDGPAALDRCEGMWAFATYDAASGVLTLSRDRFGEKPLYVLETADGLYFGSEAKFVAALAGVRMRVAEDHIWRYLVNGYKALYKRPREFFQDLRSVPAASTIVVRGGSAGDAVPFWVPRLEPESEMTFEEAVAGTRDRLIQATEIRLRSDVPLAFCMSGGVDSNALISIAKRVFDFDVHGFTIVNTDERYDEWDLVELSVRELGLRHTAVPVSRDGFLAGLRELIRQHDAPVYTITYYAQWMLQKAISEAGYKIAISGTAADELFSGYYDHHLAYLKEVRDDSRLHAASIAAWTQHVKPLVRNPHLSNPNLFVDDPNFRGHIFLDADEFADSYLTLPWCEPFEEMDYSGDLLRNRMMNELMHEAVPVILHEDDLNAMYYSIENRSPFLDRALFDFSARIPTRHLVRDGAAKAVLREAVRGIAPDAILDCRRKVGFNAPILGYLDVADRATREWLLDDGPIFKHVRKSAIEELISRPNLPNSESKFLFNFVNAKIFLEEFGQK